MSFNGAFIIPTSNFNGQKYFYFGLERNGEVSAFGGKRDIKENIQNCAVREFEEETLGVFCKGKKITPMLKDQKKHGVAKVDKYPSVTYFVPLKVKNNPMRDFARKRKSPKLKRHQKEMSEIIAVKASEVINQLANHPHAITFQGHKARPLLASVLKIAQANGAI